MPSSMLKRVGPAVPAAAATGLILGLVLRPLGLLSGALPGLVGGLAGGIVGALVMLKSRNDKPDELPTGPEA